MLDIMTRLETVRVPCTCFSKSKLFMEHDQLCQHRIVLEADSELRTLRTQIAMLGKIVKRETP
jgi:hypothetical protein